MLKHVAENLLGQELFVKSLQQALYKPALEYYTAHSKRVRRKRNRHSQAVSSYPMPYTPVGTAGLGRLLRPEGWTVRYEYKMACFAEFCGEDHIALKHYQDTYGMLVIMFGSTAILPPRTKRWAEAKVLADCINIKVAKLYLYNNEHCPRPVPPQHCILAELLEHGTQSKLVIPDRRPVNPALVAATMRSSVTVPSSALEIEAMRMMGINPSHALQHLGYYYYMAAKCTAARRERFLVAAEENQSSPGNPSPGFMNEKKVEHLVIILELYTKTYELFKKYAPANSQNRNQGHLTLWIAYRSRGNSRWLFFERIAKSYRREKWGLLLRPLLATWYACAGQLGVVELSIRLLVEMLGYGGEESDDPASLEEDLLAVLQSSVPSTPDPEPMVVDLAESRPMFGSSAVFWTSEVKVGEPAAFQLCLTAPNDCHRPIPALLLSGHLIFWESATGRRAARRFRNVRGAAGSPAAHLRWQPGACIVFTGSVSSDTPVSFKISKVILTLSEGPWTIQIPFDPSGRRGSIASAGRWLSSVEPPWFLPIAREDFSSVIIRHRPHSIVMTLSHKAPAYLDEDYPILVEVTNADNRELEVMADVLLQPTEIDGTDNMIALDDESSPSLIKGINFGVLQPGVSVVKTLHLISRGAAGECAEPLENPELQDMTETLQTLIVPTLDAIKVKYGVVYKRAAGAHGGVADLRTYDHNFWDDGDGGAGVVTAQMECVGPWGLEVACVKLLREDNEHAKVIMDLGEDLDLEEADIIGPGKYEVGLKANTGIWRTRSPNNERLSPTAASTSN
ncbi:Gryzun, putative trafficking through golgi-domain-containing protein [Mycena galopus ATCC 62051]|nr:Gryzun, putative trafficking through golgi-domain-containing protein [Mycena galopus ATCC 62051]